MKQSEPADPRNSRTERSAACFQQSALAAEISGYADIGMKNEALRAVRKVLAKRRLLPEEFSEAVRTLGMYFSPKSSKKWEKWKPKLEAAYNRQSRQFKRKARPDMVEMYGFLKEWDAGLQYLSIRRPSGVSEMFFGMDILLALDKLDDAKALASRCWRALSSTTDRVAQSLLLEALACFLARTHRWDEASAVWQQMPLDLFRCHALTGPVELHLARALEGIEHGLRALAKLKESPMDDSLAVPNFDLDVTREAEKQLVKYKRGIEKLLSKKLRKELGVSGQAIEKPIEEQSQEPIKRIRSDELHDGPPGV